MNDLPVFLFGFGVFLLVNVAVMGALRSSSRQHHVEAAAERERAHLVRRRQAHLAADLPTLRSKHTVLLPFGSAAAGVETARALRADTQSSSRLLVPDDHQ